jgi:hypothetical protein
LGSAVLMYVQRVLGILTIIRAARALGWMAIQFLTTDGRLRISAGSSTSNPALGSEQRHLSCFRSWSFDNAAHALVPEIASRRATCHRTRQSPQSAS